mgnify:CR=1 FL=1
MNNFVKIAVLLVVFSTAIVFCGCDAPKKNYAEDFSEKLARVDGKIHDEPVNDYEQYIEKVKKIGNSASQDVLRYAAETSEHRFIKQNGTFYIIFGSDNPPFIITDRADSPGCDTIDTKLHEVPVKKIIDEQIIPSITKHREVG